MDSKHGQLIVNITSDTTLRLSFRKDDTLLHLRYPGIFADKPIILDYWELKDGDAALLTNRYADRPSWFELYPTEAADVLTYMLEEKIQRGDYPEQPIDGPNIWRVREGDTVVWLGADRPDIKGVDGILRIYTFSACSLLVGEPTTWKPGAIFGAPKSDRMIGLTSARLAYSIVRSMGLPRSMSTEWYLSR